MPTMRLRPRPAATRAALALLTAVSGSLTLCIAPSVARASSTYYVDGASTNGPCSDSHTAVQAQNPETPWCTISEAVATVPSGATVDVAPAVYHEQVTMAPRDDGVTLQGTGSTRPVIDGDWTRSYGIVLYNGVHDVTIDGFEIRDLLCRSTQGYAAGIVSLNTTGDTIENNVIHGSHGTGLAAYGIMLGNNEAPGLVHNVDVRGNDIYNIGPGGESMGILLMMAKGMAVERNEVYLVRKEGIRDWDGLDNTFTSNRLYLNWTGITLEGAVGDLVDNNLAYANVWGYNPKHVSTSSSLAMWGLSTGQWSRFWHNTSYAETHADVSLGQNPPAEDDVDIRDNVFASPGDVHLHDFPTIRGPHIIVDYNVYSGSAPMYYAGWNQPRVVTYTSLAKLQAALGWEMHGQVFTPDFRNPAAGDFGFSRAGLAPGVALPDGFGDQLGAANVPAATMSWTRYPTTVVASTPEPSYLKPAGAGDGRDDSYWWSSNYNTNASVTFDLGAPKPVNTFVLDIFGQLDSRNPKGYSIQLSKDNVNYTTVMSGNNPDSEGSSYKYTLSGPVTARYVRLNLLSSFGGSTLLFSDFEIGLLTPAGVPLTGAHHAITRKAHRGHPKVRRANRKARHKDRKAHHARRKSPNAHGKPHRGASPPKAPAEGTRAKSARGPYAALSQGFDQSVDQLVQRLLQRP